MRSLKNHQTRTRPPILKHGHKLDKPSLNAAEWRERVSLPRLSLTAAKVMEKMLMKK